MTTTQLRDVLDTYIKSVVSSHNQRYEELQTKKADWVVNHSDYFLSIHDNSIKEFNNCLKSNDLTLANGFISHCEEKGIIFANDLDKHKTKKLFMRKSIEAAEACKMYINGESYPEVNLDVDSRQSNLGNSESKINECQDKSYSLRNISNKYIDEVGKSRGWAIRTFTDYKAHFNLFCEFIGDDYDIFKISRDDILRYRESVLLKIPAKRNLIPKIKKLSLEAQLSLPEKYERLSITTINEYLTSIKALFQWVKDELNEKLRNPVSQGVFLKVNTKPSAERKVFSSSNLEKVFTRYSDLENNYKDPSKINDIKWITLFAAYQGMRMEEICHLFVDDFFRMGDVLCVSIASSGARSIKNKDSIRVIPVHTNLIKLGFLIF